MGPLRNKTKLMAALFALALPWFARAGGVDGGANGLFDGQTYGLIEDYYIDPSDFSQLCGYKEFKAKLDYLKTNFPSLENQLESVINKRDWYEIPAEIEEIPAVHKRLGFSSLQFAKQPAHGHEIFINRKYHDSLCAENPVRAGKELMHEALMALQDEKREDNVRGVNNKLFAKNPNPVEIQDALATYGFGVHFTPAQVKLQKALARVTYLQTLQTITDQAVKRCANGDSLDEIQVGLTKPWMSLKQNDLKRALATYRRGEPDYGLSDYQKAFQAYHDDTTTERSFTHFTVLGPFSQIAWYSPFRGALQGFVGLNQSAVSSRAVANEVVPKTCEDHKEMFGAAACAEFKSHRSDVRPSYLGHADITTPAFDSENPQRMASLDAAYDNFSDENFDAVDLTLIKEKLARNLAFVNLMAAELVADRGNDNRDNWFGTADGQKLLAPRLQSIADKVMARRKELPLTDRDYMRRLVCNSATSVDQDIADMLNKEQGVSAPSPSHDTSAGSASGEPSGNPESHDAQ